MRSSPVPEDVDPVPRTLRIVASRFRKSATSGLDDLARGLLEDAEVLEGTRTLPPVEANRGHGRLLTRERRVPRTNEKRRRGAGAGTPRRSLLSLDDERHRFRLIERGDYVDGPTCERILARFHEAGIEGCPTAANQRIAQTIIEEEKAKAAAK